MQAELSCQLLELRSLFLFLIERVSPSSVSHSLTSTGNNMKIHGTHEEQHCGHGFQPAISFHTKRLKLQ